MSANKQSGGTGDKKSRNVGSAAGKPGLKYVSYCPTCPNDMGKATVNAGQRFASCKVGHRWDIRW
jgi:hypothetical protein